MQSFEKSKSRTLISRLKRAFKPISKTPNYTGECGISVNEAVKNFQAMHSKLMVDGIIGPKTYVTMTDYYTSAELREIFGIDDTSRN